MQLCLCISNSAPLFFANYVRIVLPWASVCVVLKLLWPSVATLQPGPMVSLGVQKDLHITMSYCWDVHETIKRIVSELQNRGYIHVYLCWLDIEQPR